jgi:transposase
MMEEAPSRLHQPFTLEAFMRSFQPPPDTQFYAGVDLHARSLFLVILDADGHTCFGRNLPAAPEPFLRAVQPFRQGLLVACACVHPWYGLADTCRDHASNFVLGHAGAMKAVHGCTTTCDRQDAEASARLLTGGNFPPAYAYPRERRGLRDLLRARLRLVRPRAAVDGHGHTARRQANLTPVRNDGKYTSKRAGITADIADPVVRRRVAIDRALREPLDTTIRQLEAEIEQAAQEHDAVAVAVLPSTPGVGLVLSLTILLETDTIERFQRRPQYCSYARLCGAVQESAGQRVGTGNRTAGNAWRKWAFSEAAVRSAQKDERIGRLLERRAARLGKAKAVRVLAPKLGRAFDHLVHTTEVVAVNRFVRHGATGRLASRRRTGAHGASQHDDTTMSLDPESATGVCGRNPGLLPP